MDAERPLAQAPVATRESSSRTKRELGHMEHEKRGPYILDIDMVGVAIGLHVRKPPGQDPRQVIDPECSQAPGRPEQRLPASSWPRSGASSS